MPTYDYVCPACDSRDERTVSVNDRDSQFCQCGYRYVRAYSVGNLSVWAPTSGGQR